MRVLIALWFLAAAPPALACEPCQEVLTLEQTVGQADLIIIGKRTDGGKPADQPPNGFGPENLNIDVLRTLKGKIPVSPIRVRSWYGMCPYGIQLEGGTALILLAKGRDGENEHYTSINWGCAPRTFTVTGGAVDIEGEKMTIDAFKRAYID